MNLAKINKLNQYKNTPKPNGLGAIFKDRVHNFMPGRIKSSHKGVIDLELGDIDLCRLLSFFCREKRFISTATRV